MHLVDYDGAEWYDHDWDSLPEMTLLRAHGLRPGAIAFNAGSNQGLQAMMLAKAVEPDGFVLGIEPSHSNVQAARRNAELNQLTNLTFIEAAASNSPGHVIITQTMNAHVVADARQFGVRQVDAVSIDELSKQYGAPQVLYIDVEGFECRVLEGARETLRMHTPDCFVEVHVNLGLEEFGGSVSQGTFVFSTE